MVKLIHDFINLNIIKYLRLEKKKPKYSPTECRKEVSNKIDVNLLILEKLVTLFPCNC